MPAGLPLMQETGRQLHQSGKMHVTAFVVDLCPAPPVSTRTALDCLAKDTLPYGDSYLQHSPRLGHLNHLSDPTGTGHHSGRPSPSPVRGTLRTSVHVAGPIPVCPRLPPWHSFRPDTAGRFRGAEYRSPHPILKARFMRCPRWFRSGRRLFRGLGAGRRTEAGACHNLPWRTGPPRCRPPGPGPCSLPCCGWTCGPGGPR